MKVGVIIPLHAPQTGPNVFAPTYALHGERAGGVAGTFTDLDQLAHWARDHGATVVSTLPLLATFVDEPLDPSPYSPVSLRFWNELFVDPTTRRGGVGRALLAAAADFARADGAAGLTLETGRDNAAARALYRAAGWHEDASQWYSLPLA